ncbi:MAG: tetratricopeptide repeat protein [Thermoanaerobaculia bacterium]
MRTKIRIAAALAAFLTAGFLHAGAQCRLLGVVTDSAGAPVEGVSVLVTTPSLTTFKLAVKTDGKGSYGTLLNDCTMPYHVRFEKEGYAPYDVDKKIPIGDMGKIDTQLMKISEAAAKAAPGAPAAPAPSGNEQAIIAYNEGVEALNAGDKAGAETKFLDAVKKNPDLPAGWLALTQLAQEKKEWAKVVEYGRKATDLDPTQTNVYAVIAEASRQMGDKKGAEEWTARYAEANPNSPEILYNKGIELYNKNKLKDAEAMLTKAVEAKPDFADAHFWLGMSAFTLKKYPIAKEHLQKYLELDPNGKEAGTAKEILPLLK